MSARQPLLALLKWLSAFVAMILIGFGVGIASTFVWPRWTGVLSGPAPIAIGALLTSDPAYAASSMELEQGIRMAIDELNSRGGIDGHPLELVTADTGVAGERAVAAFQELESRHSPFFYISLRSEVAREVAPLLEEADAVLISTVTADETVTELSERMYRYWPSSSEELEDILPVWNAAATGSSALVLTDNVYGQSFWEEFQQTVDGENSASDVVWLEPSPDTNAAAVVDQVASRSAIMFVGTNWINVPLVQYLLRSEYQGTLIFGSNAMQPEFIASAGQLPADTYILAPAFYSGDYEFSRRFKAAFRQRYDQEHVPHLSAIGYDITKLFSSLSERGVKNAQELQEELNQGFSYLSTLGSIRLEPGQQSVRIEYKPAQVEASRLQFVSL